MKIEHSSAAKPTWKLLKIEHSITAQPTQEAAEDRTFQRGEAGLNIAGLRGRASSHGGSGRQRGFISTTWRDNIDQPYALAFDRANIAVQPWLHCTAHGAMVRVSTERRMQHAVCSKPHAPDAPCAREAAVQPGLPVQGLMAALACSGGSAVGGPKKGEGLRLLRISALQNPGSVLLSHRVAPAVPLARESLTSVFGMGTGVTSPA